MNIDFSNILSSGAHPAAAGTAAVTSFLGTLGLATHAMPVPDAVPSWLPYATTILGPLLVMLFGRFLAAKAAQDRALAASKERRAKELLSDTNPANDSEANKLQDEADVLKAKADAWEAAGRKAE